MLKVLKIAVASGLFAMPFTSNVLAQYAGNIVSYTPGVDFATEFGTGLGYTNAVAALGAPSTFIPGEFGGPVDPFNPPYLRDQVVSVGTGGSLVVQLAAPAMNSAANPFGIDFQIFGNSGFVITNGDYSGGGITDGSLFAANEFSTKVSVSSDGQTFFTLNPLFAPTVDAYYPTDGAGGIFQPVNPALRLADFSGKGLAGIRQLYAGSAGGAGYDLAWAVDGAGNPVQLSEISFIRVDVLGGASEIDAIVVVPEPATLALLSFGGLAAAFIFRRKH